MNFNSPDHIPEALGSPEALLAKNSTSKASAFTPFRGPCYSAKRGPGLISCGRGLHGSQVVLVEAVSVVVGASDADAVLVVEVQVESAATVMAGQVPGQARYQVFALEKSTFHPLFTL